MLNNCDDKELPSFPRLLLRRNQLMMKEISRKKSRSSRRGGGSRRLRMFRIRRGRRRGRRIRIRFAEMKRRGRKTEKNIKQEREEEYCDHHGRKMSPIASTNKHQQTSTTAFHHLQKLFKNFSSNFFSLPFQDQWPSLPHSAPQYFPHLSSAEEVHLQDLQEIESLLHHS